MNDRLKALTDAGVSIWLDDLSRERLTSGNLAALIQDKHVVGVTTNPTIFAKAISDADAYAEQVSRLAAQGVVHRRGDPGDHHRRRPRRRRRVQAGVRRHRRARTAGSRSRSSRRWRTTPRRRSRQAKELWEAVDRENVFVKIPATKEGLPAITATLAAGISVNVTLIFSLDRYKAVMDAFLTGLEQAIENGHDVTKMASVASFFVSRVDTEVDKRLDAIGTDEAKALKGKAAIANARLAFEAYEEIFDTDRWRELETAGAQAAASAVGVHRHQGPVVLPHPVRRQPGHQRRRQHDA